MPENYIAWREIMQKEKQVYEEAQSDAREMRSDLMAHYREWLKKKKEKGVTERDNQNAMVHIKWIEAQGKSVMNDVHIGNLIHKQEKLLLDKSK